MRVISLAENVSPCKKCNSHKTSSCNLKTCSKLQAYRTDPAFHPETLELNLPAFAAW